LGPKKELVPWLKEMDYEDSLRAEEPFHVDGMLMESWRPPNRVSVEGWHCLEAALHAVEQHDNLADILKASVQYGGDTDTVGAIAMAMGSVSEEVEQNLPQNLIDGLENKPRQYGRDYLVYVDKLLLEAYPRTGVAEKTEEE
jgi:ADP-ribosylglycohydrolase